MAAPDKDDEKIDDLYRGPLSEFTAARNALVKTLRGADASRIRKLAKPTVVPWAVNQVYWHARNTYDRLIKSGERLRKAQIAALEGRKADLREAGDAHRRAIADAVQEAERLAKASGSQPGPDALMRTFEALSLAGEPPEQPGRLTKELQPAGFEALTGVTPAPRAALERQPAKAKEGRDRTESGPAKAGRHRTEAGRHRNDLRPELGRERQREEAAAARREAAEEKKREAEIAKAQAAVERARAAAALARHAYDRAIQDVADAEERLRQMKAQKVN